MWKLREVIPPLTVRTPAGQLVHAWDYKQKKNLVIAFLREVSEGGVAPRRDFLAELKARAAELEEQEAVALVVYDTPQPRVAGAGLPAGIVVATDESGRSQRAFLGDDAFGPTGAKRLGVSITDRYGELHAQWAAQDEDGLPDLDEVLSWLGQIQVACEECGAPHWPAES